MQILIVKTYDDDDLCVTLATRMFTTRLSHIFGTTTHPNQMIQQQKIVYGL